ncbi:MAG: sugar transferase [Thermodesulfobacteriota bacterium]
MHILLIHQAFVPPQGPGSTRHYELVHYLVREGHRVTIVASDLSYLTGKRAVTQAELGDEEMLDGIRVFRAYTYPGLHRSSFWRVVSFLSFMVTSLFGAMRAGQVDLVMGTSPPIFQAVSAWVFALIRRRPFLFEIRDLWPEFAIDIGVLTNRFLIFLSRWLERFLYAQATHLLVNSPAYRDYVLGKGIAERKITLIPNGVDTRMFQPEARGEQFRREWNLDGKFVVTYAGALGLANDIPSILRAADRLRSNSHIHFLLVGDGKERTHLESTARELGLTNITFAGAQPKTKMPEVLAASDACVATLQAIPMFRTTYPNKVFDYMAAGRPTILAIDGVIRKVLEAAAGGIFVLPGNSDAMAAAVLQLADDPSAASRMGASARDFVVRHFDRDGQARSFLELVTRLVRQHKAENLYRRLGKRVIDLVLALAAFLALLPVLSVIAVSAYVTHGRPIFFRQGRPGLRGRPFSLMKFRTMTDARDVRGNFIPDRDRLTALGRFLRSTSLDELPELFNVLKGDMSLVGPRPLLMQYLDRYTPEQARRHEVKPGITGWAQVNGRNAITWEEKFKLDVWYVDNWSLWLDLKIIAMTIWKILKREGISQPGQATAEEFKGTEVG